MENTSTKTNQISFFKKFKKKIKIKEKIFFIQNLRTMIKAGMSLTESLHALIQQTENQNFKIILQEMVEDIEKGQTLAESMAKQPNIFSPIFVNMIAAGEASGNLENILGQLYLQVKKDYELISKIKGAMAYPLVVLVAMMIMVSGMMFFVFPTFVSLFKDAGTQLPLITRVLIGISDFTTSNWYIVFPSIGLIIFALLKFIKTKAGEKIFHMLLLKAFLIGPITQKINLARFSRSISALLSTDIPIMKSFEITASVVGNVHYQKALLESIDKIKKGSTISDALSSNPKLFPPMIIQMLMVGEKSGTTDVILQEIANFYEDEVDNTTKNLSSVVEPILILLIGGVVGVVAIAVMMPMYNMAQNF